MVTSQQCLQKFGEPEKVATQNRNMVLWSVPPELHIGVIPKKIYCNKLMVTPLSKAFKCLIDTNKVNELKTWDGCFNIRKKRGLRSLSLHSWGIAIDLNAAWNGLGKEPTLSKSFVKCFTENGFDWGGTWQRKDGMHFQLTEI